MIRFLGVAETANVTTTLPSPYDKFTIQPGQAITTWTQSDITVSADKPVMVGQILVSNQYCGWAYIGDPSLTVFPPVEQYRTEYVILTPPSWTKNYVAITAPVTTKTIIDGSATDSCPKRAAGILEGVPYESRRCPLKEGVHLSDRRRALRDCGLWLRFGGLVCLRRWRRRGADLQPAAHQVSRAARQARQAARDQPGLGHPDGEREAQHQHEGVELVLAAVEKVATVAHGRAGEAATMPRAVGGAGGQVDPQPHAAHRAQLRERVSGWIEGVEHPRPHRAAQPQHLRGQPVVDERCGIVEALRRVVPLAVVVIGGRVRDATEATQRDVAPQPKRRWPSAG